MNPEDLVGAFILFMIFAGVVIWIMIAVLRMIGRGVANLTTTVLEESGVSKKTARTIGCVVGGVTAGMIGHGVINTVNNATSNMNIPMTDGGDTYTDQNYNVVADNSNVQDIGNDYIPNTQDTDCSYILDKQDVGNDYVPNAEDSCSDCSSNVQDVGSDCIPNVQDNDNIYIPELDYSDSFDTSIYSSNDVGTFSSGISLAFGDISVDTIIDIPEVQNNPYMLFTTYQTTGNFSINDANGLQQLSVIDGNVYDATNTLIGGMERDDITGVTALHDLANNTVMSMDCQNNIYAGTPETGHLVGHIDKGVAANTIRDLSGGIVSYTDQFGNAWANGKPLGSIRKI